MNNSRRNKRTPQFDPRPKCNHMNGIFDTNLGTFGAANSLPGKIAPYVLVDIICLARWIGLVLLTNFDVNVFSEK